MQLILNTERDIGIPNKMSTIEQESFDEKFTSLAEKIDDDVPNIREECLEEDFEETCVENGDRETSDIVSKDDNNSIEKLNQISGIDETEKSGVTNLSIECKLEKIHESVPVIEHKTTKPVDCIIIENTEKKEIDDNIELHVNEEEKDKEIKLDVIENVDIVENQDDVDKSNTDRENVVSSEKVNDVTVQDDINDALKTYIPVELKPVENKAPDIENDEVINIPDEKEEESIKITDQEIMDVDKQSDTLLKLESENDRKIEPICKDKDGESDVEITSPSTKSNLNSKIVCSDENLNKPNKISDKHNEQDSGKCEQEDEISSVNNKNEPKKVTLICKLSNTLDILSDEEEETVQNESETASNSVKKQCIDVEEDDDIMLIDEEINDDSEKIQPDSSDTPVQVKEEDHDCKENPHVSTINFKTSEEKEPMDVKKESPISIETELRNPKEDDKPIEIKPIHKPLLPVNFLKTSQKNFADMTRDELEEFCILKMVESVVDRSNLSELKRQLTAMAKNIDEYMKKAQQLGKQNRDLQLVLKSVQEEQKKNSGTPITPLKITRSVGMQVLMTDKVNVRRKSLIPNNTQNNVNINNSTSRVNKTQTTNQSPKVQKPASPINSQPIPVPRLVPAATTNNKIQTPGTNIATKTSVGTNLPNGIRNSPPIQKPEKRTHNKMQQSNSDTVDLTDDEPPLKVPQRNVNPPVRLVPPQNLLAPQRQAFGTNNNSSPRKVYIPISGSQNQVRTGQTIMFKPVIPATGPRPRLPNILPKPNSNTSMTRASRLSRHPAPLPDSLKQYQPPNWKDLPPAPELKLSKVENGIVISWKIDGYQEENHEEIASYQLYAYQETSSPPSTALWKKIGDVKALPLPMACTLTQFMAGYKYYFAVRAVDIRSRLGPFSAPGSILLLNKM